MLLAAGLQEWTARVQGRQLTDSTLRALVPEALQVSGTMRARRDDPLLLGIACPLRCGVRSILPNAEAHALEEDAVHGAAYKSTLGWGENPVTTPWKVPCGLFVACLPLTLWLAHAGHRTRPRVETGRGRA